MLKQWKSAAKGLVRTQDWHTGEYEGTGQCLHQSMVANAPILTKESFLCLRGVCEIRWVYTEIAVFLCKAHKQTWQNFWHNNRV